MDILGLIAVLSFGLTCFGIGYTFGKDNKKTKIAANAYGAYSPAILSATRSPSMAAEVIPPA